jgi:hypothetical protein
MPRKYLVVLILFCIVLNTSGFLWKLFEPVLFYDEIAHFITPFTLVLILAEIIYRTGEMTSSSTHPCGPLSQALSSGSWAPQVGRALRS